MLSEHREKFLITTDDWALSGLLIRSHTFILCFREITINGRSTMFKVQILYKQSGLYIEQ